MNTKLLSKISKEQDTRTTCTLSQEGSAALDCLMNEYGLTQKQAVELCISNGAFKDDVINMALASNNKEMHRQVRKSLVVTKKNLKLLNETSEKIRMQRDVIIDFSFRYLVSAIKLASQMQKEQYQKALGILNNVTNFILEAEKELQGILEDDDAILSRFSTVYIVQSNLVRDVKDNVINGTNIDPDGR